MAAKNPLRLRRKEERADTNGFSRAVADAVGVGRREAFGVRQLAAALFLCPNNVPVPIRGVPPQTSAAADWSKGQFAGHAELRGQNPNCEPVTLSSSLPKAVLF
ncbi:MAG TPA: hypothetical protein PLW35_08040 [Verrucomicrobiota bacterium]|nr:hypothetical protein [Verrucomicrobiota bacterium]